MNRFIIGIFFLLSSFLHLRAATPLSQIIFTNLDNRDFIVTFAGTPPTNYVRINLDPTQFNTNTTTVHITDTTVIGKQFWDSTFGNLYPVGFVGNTNRFLIRQTTGFTGTGTNYFGDDGVFHPVVVTIGTNDLWADVGNVYFPAQPEDMMIATNIQSARQLTSLGAFLMPTSLSSNLVSGENDLNIGDIGHVLLQGSSTDPNDSWITLNAGNGQGQFLFIENGPTSGLALSNGVALWDTSGFIILANGDWRPTARGETIFLMSSQNGNWQEIGRFGGGLPQNNSLWATNSALGTIGPLMAPIRFQIDQAGDLVKLRSVTYAWPSSQGAASTVLQNNGSGTLSWATVDSGTTINPTDFYIPFRTNATTFLDSSWKQVASNIIAEATYSRFGTLAALPNFSAKPIIAIRATTADPALTIDSVQNSSRSALNMYNVITNGSSGPSVYLQQASAGTLGTTARMLQIDAYAGSAAGGTNSPVRDNSVSGTVGIYVNASQGAATNTTYAGLIGSVDSGYGNWNVGVGSFVVPSTLNPASVNTAIHAKTHNKAVGQTVVAGYFETEATGDAAKSYLGESAVVVADSRTTGLPSFIGRSANGTTTFKVLAASGYAGAGTKFLADDGTYKTGGGGGTTINPTDAYVPVRANSTTFDDSYLAKSAANEMYFTNSALKVDFSLDVNPRFGNPGANRGRFWGNTSSAATLIEGDHISVQNNAQNRIGTTDAFDTYGVTAYGGANATAVNPQQFSPNIDWIGSAYSTNAGTLRLVGMGSQLQTFGAADEPSGILTFVSHINGAAVTNFSISTASGWTGTGANVFKDDGTFGAGGSGDAFWQTNTGSANVSPTVAPTLFTINDLGSIGIGETNIFYDKDIGIFHRADTEGNRAAWINIGVADTWPNPTYGAEFWAKNTTNEAIMCLTSLQLPSGSGNAYDHLWVSTLDGSNFYYMTKSNNVPTFQLDGISGDLSIIKSVPYSWPTANAAGLLTSDDSGNLTWGTWYNYTSTDMEGGAVYGTASTNAALPKAFDFAVNNLTNAWGGTSMVMNMGAAYDEDQPDVNGLAQGNADIFMFGGNLNGTTVTNSGTFFLLGYNLVNSHITNGGTLFSIGQNFSRFHADGSSGYYALGNGSWVDSTNLNNSHDNYSIGSSSLDNTYYDGAIDSIIIGINAGDGIRMINNEDTFGFGQHVLGGVAVLDSTHDVMAIQNPALFNAKITNSYVITAISGGNGAILNDSKFVSFWGAGAGDLINSALTNVFFIGNGATIGPTGKDQVIFGPDLVINVPKLINVTDIYATNNVSALSFTDRSDSPTNTAEAYAIVRSHEAKGGRVNHQKLHSRAWAITNTVQNGIIISAPDQSGRNLSMVVSAQALVISDLTNRAESMETQMKALMGLIGVGAAGLGAMKLRKKTAA